MVDTPTRRYSYLVRSPYEAGDGWPNMAFSAERAAWAFCNNYPPETPILVFLADPETGRPVDLEPDEFVAGELQERRRAWRATRAGVQ